MRLFFYLRCVVHAAFAFAVLAALGCGAGRSTSETPPRVAADTVITDMIGRYMDKQAEELARIEGSVAERVADEIRVTWDSAIIFDFDSAMLKVDFHKSVNEMAEVFARYPDTDIIIAGHTDSDGPEPYNQKLSERRAISLRNYLVDRGVAPSRLTAVGYGGLQPVSSNDSEENRRMNSRVEIRIRANEELSARAAETDIVR